MKVYLTQDSDNECISKFHLGNKVRTFLKVNSHIIVDEPNQADYILINTCGVTQEMEDRYLGFVKDLSASSEKKTNIIIFGCLGKISEELHKMDGVYKIINLKEEIEFNTIFSHTTPIQKVSGSFLNKRNSNEFFIQISRGCVHNCTYCATKKSIGYVKSRPIEEIEKDFLYALSEGIQRIFFVSDDVSSYGKDLGIDLSDLMRELCKHPGDYSFVFDYMEASEFMKCFDRITPYLPRIMEINLPVQSFSNRILGLMGRKYTIEEYVALVENIRKVNPKIHISTGMIYCYPTETYEEFISNIKGAQIFDFTSGFIYSYRNGTKRYSEDELLESSEIAKRYGILKKLQEKFPKMYEISL